MTKKILIYCVLFTCGFISNTLFSQNLVRNIIPLTNNWQFSFVTNVYKHSIAQTVSIPHTWNAQEVMTPNSNYQRTSAVYRNTVFIDPAWKGKRFYLFFEGANSVADVFVNKRYVGEHKGGYTKFCFEITPFVQVGQNNDINVMVSNTYRLDVLPMSGDFNVYGGLHRPVSLIVTEQNCITLLDYGSSGVYITPKNISNAAADVDVHVKLSILNRIPGIQLRAMIVDATNKQITNQTINVIDSDVYFKQTILHPHLWQGRKDAYLYQLKVQLLQNGAVIDTVSQYFGIRTYKVDPDKGFFLNGEYLDLHGVDFHEDIQGKGSAYIMQDYLKDLSLLNELGVTALRFSHYPHGAPMYDLTDQNGIAVWTEIPFIGSGGYVGEGYANSETFHQHARNFLTELIRQNYNHPSIFFWGLFNELTANFDNPAPFLKELNELAHREDSTRLTTCADMLDHSPFDTISDVKAWNKYFGWYEPDVREIGKWLDERHQLLPQKPIGLSEYGAGASIHQHEDSLVQPKPSGKFHPEEWQTYYHEQYWQELSARPFVWGKFVWVFADFGSVIRNEGDTVGINDKGLVTYDRSVKKDAFYFYKANWNQQESVLYIADKRNTTRSKSLIDIEIFSNQPSVELFINGKSVGRKSPDSIKRAIWLQMPLQKGMNRIEARSSAKGKPTLTDQCEWEVK
jgi:beta-galactosidase